MNDFKKYFLNMGMAVTFVAAMIFPLAANFTLIRYGRFAENLRICDRTHFFGLTINNAGLFIPMFTGFPAATILGTELKSGYYQYIVMRKSKVKYIVRTLIMTMLAGGVGTALPGITTAVVSMFAKPYTGNEVYTSILALGWLEKYCSLWNGNVAILIYIFTMFIFGCVWGIFALIFSVLFRNVYITLVAPFFTTFLIQIVFNEAHLEKYSPMNMFGAECFSIPSMSFAMVYEAILAAVFSVIYVLVAERRLDNG
ncbi:MAG: hypothetical protein ACI4EU_00885 [Butyrivibrio sp.]